jgi:hypothetical protein
MSFSWWVVLGCSDLNLGELQEDRWSLQVEGLLASWSAKLLFRCWEPRNPTLDLLSEPILEGGSRLFVSDGCIIPFVVVFHLLLHLRYGVAGAYWAELASVHKQWMWEEWDGLGVVVRAVRAVGTVRVFNGNDLWFWTLGLEPILPARLHVFGIHYIVIRRWALVSEVVGGPCFLSEDCIAAGGCVL